MRIVNRHHTTLLTTPHGSEIRPLIDRTTSDATQCSLAEEVLPVGAAVGCHYHRETEEIYYLLSGTGHLTISDETRHVAAGDAIFIPRHQPHTLANTGEEPIRLLLVCGPAHSFDDYYPYPSTADATR